MDIAPDPQRADSKRALTRDLSRSGARFLTVEPFHVGENVEIRIVSGQDDEQIFDAKVVRKEGVTHQGAWRYEIAVEFESVLPEIVAAHLQSSALRLNQEEAPQQTSDKEGQAD